MNFFFSFQEENVVSYVGTLKKLSADFQSYWVDEKNHKIY